MTARQSPPGFVSTSHTTLSSAWRVASRGNERTAPAPCQARAWKMGAVPDFRRRLTVTFHLQIVEIVIAAAHATADLLQFLVSKLPRSVVFRLLLIGTRGFLRFVVRHDIPSEDELQSGARLQRSPLTGKEAREPRVPDGRLAMIQPRPLWHVVIG